MHYFQWNIKSYQAATAHLSNEEDLAYRRLIEMYYDTEQPIPSAIPVLSRRLRVGIPVLENVLKEFFVPTEDGWKNEYCDALINEYRVFKERQRINGSKGGRGNKADAKPKKATGKPDKPSAKPTINHKQETTNHKQETKNQGNSKSIAPSALLASLGIDGQLAIDFIKHRATKKAVITETAMKGFIREAEKAGITLQEAIRITCERGWIGFNAGWLKNKPSERDLEAERRAFIGGTVIEGESKNVG